MRPLSLLRLRLRVSLDELRTLVVTVLPVVLVARIEALRVEVRSGDGHMRAGA
jgi:hypothetical protein